MAYIGLAKPYVARLVNEVRREYSDCFLAGEAISMDISPEYNEANLHGDNHLTEYRKDFKQAGVKMNTTRLPIVAASIMFGHEVNDGEVIYRTTDSANYCGVGFYVTESIDGIDKFVSMIVYKTKFTESQEGYSTKGGSIEYKTPSVEGVASSVGNNVWKKTKVFDTEQEANEWIQTELGYRERCSSPTADKASGTYTGALTIQLKAGSGEQIYYTVNGITPNEKTGILYENEIVVDSSLAVKAIAVKEGNLNSDVVTYEYIMEETN